MILFLIVLLLGAFVATPYIFVLYKRARMLRKLVRTARREGFRVRRLHRAPYLCRNRATKYDLLFEAPNHVYAIKLWSAFKKNTALNVKGGAVMESVTVSNPFEPTTRKPYLLNGFWHRVPVTRNNFKVRRGKLVVGILLCYPTYTRMTSVGATGKKRLEWGDKLFEKIVCNPSFFEGIIREDAKSFERAEDARDGSVSYEIHPNTQDSTF